MSDYASSLYTRDGLRAMIQAEIERQRPAPRYATVVSIDRVNKTCVVRFTGENDAAVVGMGALQPAIPGEIVRIEGVLGNRYIAGVAGASFFQQLGFQCTPTILFGVQRQFANQDWPHNPVVSTDKSAFSSWSNWSPAGAPTTRWAQWNVFLPNSGTWVWDFFFETGSDAGQVQISYGKAIADGSTPTLTNLGSSHDLYPAGTPRGILYLGSNNILDAGWYTIRLTVTGKNGLSTAYTVRFAGMVGTLITPSN